MDGKAGHGSGDVVRAQAMGERSIDVFQDTVQFDESILWSDTTVDVYLSSELDSQNEILFDGTVT